MRGAFGPHLIAATVTNNTMPVVVTLVSILRRCFWGETEIRTGGSRDGTCVRCDGGLFSLSTRTCELCPVDATCHASDAQEPYGSGKMALIPNDGYWHRQADSSTIFSCRNPDACGASSAFRESGQDEHREGRLRTCQEASWQLLNSLEIHAAARRDVAAAGALPKALKAALVR